MLIELSHDTIRLSRSLLGTEEAWLWVGSAFSSFDNDDTRVKETRALMERYYPHVPYGMWVGNRLNDAMISLSANEDKHYTLNASWWPVGVYRVNLHTARGIESPFGSKLHPENRDQDCSWSTLENFQSDLADYLHKEENGAGYSLRFLIHPDRSIEPFGDSK
ncbi:MAG: hypothetical protein WBO92_00600 [Candidatus Moraniibacteriota bacterium]